MQPIGKQSGDIDMRFFACPPVDNVRIGFIGLGNRGIATLKRYMVIEGVTVTAICDKRTHNLQMAEDIILGAGLAAPLKFDGDDGWLKIAECPDVDLLYICTDWASHTEIALNAMENGKHVAVEVPAALTIEDCHKLVEVATAKRRHCFMLENCCFDPFALNTLEMAKQGWFGKITHCEGAYIHDLRRLFKADENAGGFYNRWIEKYCSNHDGNPYPTHGIGPVSQLLEINRGDRFDYLVSMNQDASAKESGIFMNSTLLRTVRGRTVLLQFDVTTPRPYSRLQVVCGTKGFIRKYPVECATDNDGNTFTGKSLEDLMSGFTHPFVKAYRDDAFAHGVENMMNYIMDRRLIDCLRSGSPLDISVYDAATWSSIAQLSEISAKNGSIPVKFPDFTNGHWE